MTLALAIVASLGFAVQEVPGTVQGVVRDAQDGAPIAGAEVVLAGTGKSALTAGDGTYAIAGVAGGSRRLIARRLGFAPLEVDLSVPGGGLVSVDFHLQVEAVHLPPIGATVLATVVEPAEDDARPEPETLPAGAVVRVLDASPGVSELGIGAKARALLGPDPPAPDNVLYVRGAGASLDLVLLDGAPVHAPFHLGGLVDPGLPPSIARAQRLQGGVTARYDGGLSDVLLLASGPGEEGARGRVFLDMLTAGGSVEAVSGERGSVFASYRLLHGSWEDGLLPGATAFPQRYSDAMLRADLVPDERGADTVSFTLFRNEESVRLGLGAPADEPEWGNTAGSLRIRTPTHLGRLELGGALGAFDTRLPVGAVDPLIATGTTRRARVWADFSHSLGATELGYGIQGDRLGLRTRFRETEGSETEVTLRQRADAGAFALWLEGQRAVLPRLDVVAGLRANFFTDGLGRSLSPRLKMGWQVGDDVRLTGSYGRFHQLVVTVDTELPVESTVITADGQVFGSVLSRVAAARSTHFVAGVTHAPTPGRVMRVEAFWKSSTGVPEFGEGALRTAGMDVLVSRPLASSFVVWGAYTLAWAWADYPDAAAETVYDARHFLRGGVTFAAPDQVRLDADLSMGRGLEFGAVPRSERTAVTPAEASASATAGIHGHPASPISRVERTLAFGGPGDAGGPIFTRAPDRSYLRLNLQATAEFDVRMFGRDQRLLPYFRIVNALDRRDALFYRYDGGEEGAEPRAVGSVPILPVIGLEWRI